ncbi:NADH-quinone oxidoreductase subunit A [Buchnera aphidicola (Eriosoma grossulariae)]|uniref:NADH-quinone oxidoreductase subunit A n=1 Tax=Buchnera aphidicola TaxID=9 RepID=UPI00346439DC
MNKNCIFLYLPFIAFIISAFLICIFMLFCGWFLGGIANSRYKHTPFESGIVGLGNTHIRVSIKFYLIAMCFLIFDVETVYLYAWITTINDTKWIGFFEILIFIIELLIGLIYLVRLGCFNWNTKKNNIKY